MSLVMTTVRGSPGLRRDMASLQDLGVGVAPVLVGVAVHGDAQAAPVGQGHARVEFALLAEAIQGAGHVAGVAAEFALIFFEGVEFLDHFQGQDQMIVFKLLEGGGVVQEYVGVEDVVFLHANVASGAPMGYSQFFLFNTM
jgi:hypothetical protein